MQKPLKGLILFSLRALSHLLAAYVPSKRSKVLPLQSLIPINRLHSSPHLIMILIFEALTINARRINIILARVKTQTQINVVIPETADKQSLIFFWPNGSVKAAQRENPNDNDIKESTGEISCIVKRIVETIPIPFFTTNVQPINVSTVSENIPPMIGTNLSMANFAVFIVTPSIVAAPKPFRAVIPKNTTNTVPRAHCCSLFERSDLLLHSLKQLCRRYLQRI